MGRIVRASGPAAFAPLGPAQAQRGGLEAPGAAVPGARETGDGYLERVAKFVPAEVVGFFIFVNSILAAAIEKEMAAATPETFKQMLQTALAETTMAGLNVWTISWAAVAFGFVMTPLYLLAMRDPADPKERVSLNVVMAMLAFPVWAYAVNAVAFRPWHDGALASVVLAAFSCASGAISPDLLASLRRDLRGGRVGG